MLTTCRIMRMRDTYNLYLRMRIRGPPARRRRGRVEMGICACAGRFAMLHGPEATLQTISMGMRSNNMLQVINNSVMKQHMVFGSLNDCMHLADRNVRQRSYPDDRLSRISQLHSYAEQGRSIDTQNMARKKCRAVIGRFTVTVRIRGIGDNGKLAAIVLLQRESSSGPGHESECSRGIAQQKAYAVLIGIAMRAAQAANYGHRLPVMEIYRFIE